MDALSWFEFVIGQDMVWWVWGSVFVVGRRMGWRVEG